LSGALLKLGFWFPLLVCSWLALAPEPPDVAVFKVSDVLLHGFAFSYLTFSLALAHPKLFWWQISGLMLCYGLFIEVAQSFGDTRSAELKDMLVDVVGILVGLLLVRLLADRTRRLVSWLFDRTRTVRS
jgi:VanZ family protein